VAIVGLGGGGSHVVQQLAHIGVGNFLVVDPDVVEEKNLNRLVGAIAADVAAATSKVEVAQRLIAAVNPAASVMSLAEPWQVAAELLRDVDVIFGCLDRYTERDQLERLARRFLIPYLDIGMDVFPLGSHFSISGQVALSLPGQPCLWCMGLLTLEQIEEESRDYGHAGGRPQVIWPNGVLASTAVGCFMQLVTPWHPAVELPVLLEYDGNSQIVARSNKHKLLLNKVCAHYPAAAVGDPFFQH
jgi:molybdopterin/thiamine biosynthesis adenylyltransferase